MLNIANTVKNVQHIKKQNRDSLSKGELIMPKETNKKQGKEKKHFMKDFKAELKRVIWPTAKQLLNNTVAVITIVLITAILVFALDFTFEKINEHGIEKLKSVVESKNTVDNSVSDEVSDTDTTENVEASNEISENAVNE